jgi:hypothetical protein
LLPESRQTLHSERGTESNLDKLKTEFAEETGFKAKQARSSALKKGQSRMKNERPSLFIGIAQDLPRILNISKGFINMIFRTSRLLENYPVVKASNHEAYSFYKLLTAFPFHPVAAVLF